MKSKFTNWKQRCSSLGSLMTNLITEEDKAELKVAIKVLENERDLGTNANGNKVKWTDKKKETLDKLLDKLNKEDELPSGAKTHLDNVFRSVFWGRRRLLYNRFLDKGLLCEEDSLGLLSDIDDQFYIKNEEQLSNNWIQGEPDNRQSKIRDMKTNWDLDSFDNAELSSIYKWQIKGYCWMDGKTEGELVYCLVNSPWHLWQNERQNLWYKMGTPDETEERWIEAVQQLERNMIFDTEKWKERYPNYDFENTDTNFSIPKIMRIKRFDVELLPEDIVNIKKRVKLARKYLIQKEKEVLNKIKPNNRSKLTSNTVIEIRKIYAEKKYSQKALSKKYKVTPQTISAIVNNVTWKNLLENGETKL